MHTFFSSDHHFGHKNIIKYCSRPFSSVEEMDAHMITSWNNKVSMDDITYYLGDFSFSSEKRTREILRQLNGDIYLIQGNHDIDRNLKAIEDETGFWAESYKELNIDNKKVILCHYPIESWNQKHHLSYHLHGHCHGWSPGSNIPRRMDVGVDTTDDYVPYSWEEIQEKLKG